MKNLLTRSLLVLALLTVLLPSSAWAVRPIENWIAFKFLTGTSHANPGTRTNIAHGLGRDINMYRIIPVAISKGDDDTDDVAAVVVDKTDATNVTVKSKGASIPFALWLFLSPLHPQTAQSFPAELR